MRTGKLLASLLLIAGVAGVSLAAFPAHAQDAGPAMKQVGLTRTGSGTFSLDVEGADIRTVVHAISEYASERSTTYGTISPGQRDSTSRTAASIAARSLDENVVSRRPAPTRFPQATAS